MKELNKKYLNFLSLLVDNDYKCFHEWRYADKHEMLKVYFPIERFIGTEIDPYGFEMKHICSYKYDVLEIDVKEYDFTFQKQGYGGEPKTTLIFNPEYGYYDCGLENSDGYITNERIDELFFTEQEAIEYSKKMEKETLLQYGKDLTDFFDNHERFRDGWILVGERIQ